MGRRRTKILVKEIAMTTTPTYQLLVEERDVAGIADDWAKHLTRADIRLRRAKPPKHVVVETTDPMFARNVQIWHPKAKVNIKE